MAEPKGGQAQVDAAFRAAKERRRVVELAERAKIAPESLSFDEIRTISDFVLAHAECGELSKINGLATAAPW